MRMIVNTTIILAAQAGPVLHPNGCTKTGRAGPLRVYGALKFTVGLRLGAEQEFNGADLSIHRIAATAEHESSW